jgi:hypothetical protein
MAAVGVSPAPGRRYRLYFKNRDFKLTRTERFKYKNQSGIK